MTMLFFVEAAMTGAGLTMLQAVTQAGERTAFVTSKRDRYSLTAGAEVLGWLDANGRLIEVDSTDAYERPASLSELLSGHDQEVGVIAAGDHYLPYAAHLAKDLGADFLTVEAVEILRDKREARKLYDQLGVGNVRWSDAPDPQSVACFASNIGGPVVIKNVRGTGSQDVVIARDESAAVRAWSSLNTINRYLRGDLMVEEYIAGPLVSCEVVVSDSQVRLLGFTDRHLSAPPVASEIGYTFPADIGNFHENIMFAAVEEISNALRISQGVLHSEFVLTSAEAHLIEVNARMPGALLSHMLRDCLDGDYYALVANAALGRPTRDLAHNGKFSSGYITYAPFKARTLAASDVEAARRYPWVVDVFGGVGPTEFVGPPEDYRGAIGHVRTVAPTASLSFAAAYGAAQCLIPPLASIRFDKV
ncbi:ATP-grasp domain-containing protein [Rathayibacter toxicus]|nr:ATP-grasp domain-containing protein [Rathayibacter toxicus]